MKKRVGFVLAIALLSVAGVSYASHLPFGRDIVSQKQRQLVNDLKMQISVNEQKIISNNSNLTNAGKSNSASGADLNKPAGNSTSEQAAATDSTNRSATDNAGSNSEAVPDGDNSQQSASGGADSGSAAVPSAKSGASNSSQNREVKLDVTAQSQEPELYNGCEVTSLSMLLSAAGHPVDKLQLADDIAKDPTPEGRDEEGNTLSWGDPNVGFVGDVTGENRGYGVYHGPVFSLLKKYIGNQAKDLTGKSFDDVEAAIAAGHPVEVWTTVEFKPSTAWVTWNSPNGSVRATLDEHAVLLVGFNDKQLFVNDPLDGTAAKIVDKDSFVAAWKDLGNQAITFSGN